MLIFMRVVYHIPNQLSKGEPKYETQKVEVSQMRQ